LLINKSYNIEPLLSFVAQLTLLAFLLIFIVSPLHVPELMKRQWQLMFIAHIRNLQLFLPSNAPWHLACLVNHLAWFLISETHMQPEQRRLGRLEQFLMLYLHALVAKLHNFLKYRLLASLARNKYRFKRFRLISNYFTIISISLIHLFNF
jgi:hypothetical protein